MHDPRISALLRLKRFEQPPPGYFDRLLGEVHRRQRAELLHRPLWKIALERTQVFFSEHSMGNLSYAGAMGVLLVAGLVVIGRMTPGESQATASAPQVAKTEAPAPLTTPAAGSNRMLVLGPQSRSEMARLVNSPRVNVAPEVSAPRYVIDARPVSYERADRF
ncbi:MAG TPA: hypothetical protein VEO95_13635 [Chthoniobacteraceae bacterium]|nr:hypothetical protein [Chthoniobacteraceae bacterium]